MKKGGIIKRAYYTIQISISNPIASPQFNRKRQDTPVIKSRDPLSGL
jgi:hypothetical protein